MNLFEDMSVFAAVVEAGSFTAAAAKLGLAKSVVSRRVADLELYVRQHHAERDLARLGAAVTARGQDAG